MNKLWNYVRLDELCDIRVGRTPRRDTPAYWGGTAVWVTISELDGGVISTSKEHVSDLAVKEIMPEPIPTGTLLFSFKLSIGKMGITGCPLYTNEAIAALVIRDKNQVSRDFMKYALQAVSHEAGANRAVLGKVLNKEKVSAIQIPLPPLAEQERIVRLLDEAEGMRKLRGQASARMEDFVPALFHAMFGKYSSDEKNSQIQKLGEICEIRTGKLNANAAVENGKYPFFTCSKEVFNIDTFAFDCEAILLSGNNASGDFDVKKYKGKFNVYQRVYVITIKPEYIDRLDYQLLQLILENNLASLKNKSIGGLTKYLTLGMITSIDIPLPPLDLQREFAQRVQEARGVQSAQAQSEERVEALYQSMLSRAFAGEL
jgi:type I restriction enzyme S subunit